jgi:hypothetical protein
LSKESNQRKDPLPQLLRMRSVASAHWKSHWIAGNHYDSFVVVLCGDTEGAEFFDGCSLLTE